MTLPITDLRILSASNKHRELINKQKIELGREYVMLPVDLNKQARGNWIFLCYRRDKDGEPITDLRGLVGKNKPTPEGYTKLPEDLNAGHRGNFIYLCYKKQGTQPPITDILVQATGNTNQVTPYGYEKIGVDLNRDAGGDFIFLYFLRSQRQEALDLSKGIQPEMAEGSGAKVEVIRAQVKPGRMLIGKQVVEILRSDTISAGESWDYKEDKLVGIEESRKDEFAMEIGLKAGIDIGGFSSELSMKLGFTESQFQSFSKQESVTVEKHLEKADVRREVRLCVLREVIEVRSIPSWEIIRTHDSLVPKYYCCLTREGDGPLKVGH